MWQIEGAYFMIKVIYAMINQEMPEDFIDSLLNDVAKKLYEQFDSGSVNPAAIINTYETEEEHNEVAGLFSADLSDNLNAAERQKALNDTVIKVKSNSLDYALKNTTDPKILQDIMTQQLKLKNIHIYL